jgi:hypothetical protein
MERVDYESLIIQDLLNFHADKSLNINPWYQRRSVWSDPQKAYLVNTVLERKPVPSIYIRHQIDIDAERSLKEVVDGQQRIRSIIGYRNDEFVARHPNHRSKVKYSQLSRAERGQFLSTALSIGYLIGATDQDVIEIFGRINSIAKSLNPQEKRNAKFSGEFKQFCLRQAVERLPFWRASKIFSANDISRMMEVQFVSDLTINFIQGLSDFSATLIDRYYKNFDEDFPAEQEISDRLEAVFAKIIGLPPELFADTIFNTDQVTLSLLVVLDALRQRNIPSERIATVIRNIDAQVTAFADLAIQTEVQADFLSGFKGGNLHRIRARTKRDEIFRAAFN